VCCSAGLVFIRQRLLVTVCCSVLQCVAVCCSVLQCRTRIHKTETLGYRHVWRRWWSLSDVYSPALVCCSALQCVAVCCSLSDVYSPALVCCSVLQCVALFLMCTVLH